MLHIYRVEHTYQIYQLEQQQSLGGVETARKTQKFVIRTYSTVMLGDQASAVVPPSRGMSASTFGTLLNRNDVQTIVTY